MTDLPRIMVAPNGARRTKADHPHLPMTVEDTVATAQACWKAGAGGLHAHVRDASGAHVLDAGLYRELLVEMARSCPDMQVQITTEAVGRYTPHEQRQLVRDVVPAAVSVSIREMLADGPVPDFYHWAREAGIAVQHILYGADDIALLADERTAGRIPDGPLQALIVLGRYTTGQYSDPETLAPLVAQLQTVAPAVDWAACAFGQTETACLQRAFDLGGKARVGFENNLHSAAGTLAPDNAARVAEIAALRPKTDVQG
ncbi:3-keto-5-aminohexanoate cleavage protein [Thalassorhabdomicrobium marinisediminis]|uniref:3-keto-5-aminohexanoate cleavage protein n=1 Tax=Thalassorhabdomicrobium marinisediminis TaxID=2170577 RepID=UPI002490F63E|nr:3-keto-5-aminohexanoate cleavage protein [Thalassorhabdomicrobium marinisediminis]